MYKRRVRRRAFFVITIRAQKHLNDSVLALKWHLKVDFVRKTPMFHVEQFDFAAPFHVERKRPKTLLNSGVFAYLLRRKNNF